MRLGFLKSFAAGLALAGTSVATMAQAACWSPQAVEAAAVRDMETMLMVSSLRCRISGVDFLESYNAFVRGSRPALTLANDRLRTHFAPIGGLNAYDRYVTAIANRYGGGAEGLACSDMQSILSAARAEGNSLSGLVRLAKVAQVEPRLPGDACPETVIAAR